MNTKQLIAAAVIFSATGAAFAQTSEATGQTFGFLGVNSPAATQSDVSSNTRSDVKQSAAPTYSFVGVTEATGDSDKVITRGKTRAEVIAELKQSEQDGTLQTAGFAGFRDPLTGTVHAAASQAVANK